jgi:DNA-directed RNA polymerase subunit delta
MNTIQKSMRDVAFELLSKKKNPVAFNKLWKEVAEVLGLTEEEATAKIGTFYTHITLDGRFILLQNNTWDLKSRHCESEWKIDMNELYKEDDSSSEDEIIDEANDEAEENDDEKEYNVEFEAEE